MKHHISWARSRLLAGSEQNTKLIENHSKVNDLPRDLRQQHLILQVAENVMDLPVAML